MICGTIRNYFYFLNSELTEYTAFQFYDIITPIHVLVAAAMTFMLSVCMAKQGNERRSPLLALDVM
jgi:hypothetical protein